MSNKVEVKELLEAGHFGHMTRKWDPNMFFIWNVIFTLSIYIKLQQN
jgi:ribosomal protein S2